MMPKAAAGLGHGELVRVAALVLPQPHGVARLALRRGGRGREGKGGGEAARVFKLGVAR